MIGERALRVSVLATGWSGNECAGLPRTGVPAGRVQRILVRVNCRAQNVGRLLGVVDVPKAKNTL